MKRNGGLIGYGVLFPALFRGASTFMDKIRKGAKPGDIPIEQATKFETLVNMKTAAALGLDVPPALLAQATDVDDRLIAHPDLSLVLRDTDYSRLPQLDISTGDEIEALAGSFNQMAGRLRESYETLEARVEARTKDLNEALRRQTATSDILRAIAASPGDLQPVLDRLVETVCSLCEAADAVIMLRDGGDLWSPAHHGPIPTPPNAGRRPISRDWPPGRAVADGAMVHVHDLAQAQDEYPLAVAISEGVARGLGPGAPGAALAWRTAVAAPLMREGAAIGTIVLRRVEVAPFSDAQLALLQTFADQAVIAVGNARLFEEVRTRTREITVALERQTATAEILKVIASSTNDAAPVFEAIVASAKRLLGGRLSLLTRFVGDIAHLAAFTPIEPDYDAALKGAFPRLSDDPVALALRAGQTALIQDTETEDHWGWREGGRQTGFRSAANVPLISQGVTIGGLTVNSAEPDAFDADDVELLRTFADQAVIAIENVRLFNETKEALERQTATSEILKVIAASTSNLQPVFDAIVENSKRLLHGVHVMSFRYVEGFAHVAAATPVDPEFDALARNFPPQPLATSPVFAAIKHGEVAQAPDVEVDDPFNQRDFARRVGLRSAMFVPLMSAGEAIGSILVSRKTPGRFAPQDVELMKSFADQAVIAIENARLFDELQTRTREITVALAQQTATADVLKVISRSAFDLQAVFDTLISSAVELVGAYNGTICVREGDEYRFRASSGVGGEWTKILAANPPKPGRGSATGRVLLTGQIHSIADVMEDADYVLPIFGVNKTRAVLGVPLLRDDVVQGALLLARLEPGPFEPRQIELVRTFADQAVIAIENARLFDEVQARTRALEDSLSRQTATAEILEVISQSPTDPAPVLDAIVLTGQQLFKCRAAGMLMADGARLINVTGAAGGKILRQEELSPPLPIDAAHNFPSRAFTSKRTHRVDFSDGDPPKHERWIRDAYGVTSGLFLPLVRGGECVGVFGLLSDRSDAFDTKEVALAESFRDQAVIALENARLFDELQARTRELEQSLADLRQAQDRLVQSEKLASLGQLTAGIAHEIKNPLNFVNNFASLSRELLEELRGALGALPEDSRADADDLMGMIDSNLEKVASHGKRADSIVKNMLLHSREGSGEHARINVNAMVEEALNLGYHGARAEKPGFNVKIEKALDPLAGEADLYPQEITRVLLNLISNGFYAGAKRHESAEPGYEPALRASTRSLGERVEIRIRDNGTGIPDEVRAKMFNPFFTTKPAGEGTGLGLSLSHDIVVKQHGGTLDVETAPGEFTEFVITLPRGGAGAWAR